MSIEKNNGEQEMENTAPKARYAVGQKIYYPGWGVTEVKAIEEKNIGGINGIFYHLHIIDAERNVLVPINAADAVGIRPLITNLQIKQALDIFRTDNTGRTGTQSPKEENRFKRKREYYAKIKSGSVTDLAEVICNLMLQKKSGPLAFAESRALSNAKDLLVKEIAQVRKQTEIEVWTEIWAIFAQR
jgi:CarD family transcriptional regulator